MIRSGGVATRSSSVALAHEGTDTERAEEECPLPQPTMASIEGGTAVSEGPLLSALLDKMETLLDQVCYYR